MRATVFSKANRRSKKLMRIKMAEKNMNMEAGNE